MKPPRFEYDLVRSTEEAVAVLAEHGDEAKVLAGGQSLVPLLGLRLAHPARLVDVNDVAELAQVDATDGLELGSMVRQRVAERSDVVRDANPLLVEAIGCIGHSAIRNRGTIGGSIAHADPAAELPMVLLALDGEVMTRSHRGTRTIPAAELFEGFLTTSIADDELLTSVRLPAWQPGTGWSLQELSRRHGDFAIAGVAVTLRIESGLVADAHVALSGVAGTPVRAEKAEQVLIGEALSDGLWAEAAATAAADLAPPSDLHGTAGYRRHLAEVLVRRALAEASSRVSLGA